MELSFLAPNILKKYEDKKPPMTELGEFVYIRTYSRWLPEKGRRENWLETITRTINYNLSLEWDYLLKNHPWLNFDKLKDVLSKEAEELLDNMFYLRQFGSGRTMWVANTEVARQYPLSNFNCSFMVLDTFAKYAEMFYLLMLGSGTGFRTMPYDVSKMEQYRPDVELECKPYEPVPANERKDLTELFVNGTEATIVIGDSKEGWVSALDIYFQLRIHFIYKQVNRIVLNFDRVRPKGSRLKRFGGTSSGHQSMETMLRKIHKIMNRAEGKLDDLSAMDISNTIAENVVSGGVRRSSQINLASVDSPIETAKTNMYYQDETGKWVENKEILHRRMSNNSIFYEAKPTREQLHQNFTNMRYTGERGFVNAKSARKRRKNFHGLNPCAK